MKTPVWTILFCLLSGSAAVAGTITGTVAARGPDVGNQPSADGAYASLRYKFAEKIDYNRLADFVVYIDQAVPEPAGRVPRPSVITQRNVSFEPHVLPIVVGTTVRWPNADDIFHNVFSMSETKEFNLGFYTTGKVPEIVFDKIGQVDVFCGIHSKMHCIILVLPSRFFAKVNARQRYVLPDVPAGTYKLKAWQERMPPKVAEVTVPAQGEVTVNFILGLGDLQKF